MSRESKHQTKIPTVGVEPEPGTIAEMLYRPDTGETAFAVYDGRSVRYEHRISGARGRLFVPYSPENNLVANGIVLFPSTAAEYASEEILIEEVRAFIHRYVDLSPLFETIAVHYVLLSWIYDDFNELPYLRIRGDFGSGKTRFLTTIGSLMFRPMFASGASSISPIFRIIDRFRGTLIVDEANFRLSDEKAELVKILNNGNARGFPVLRTEQSASTKEFNPVAYNVFGPKIAATRRFFDDRALESRFITEDVGTGNMRSDVPISLPVEFGDQALAIRNKLLMFRFRNLHRRPLGEERQDSRLEPRVRQIFRPLLGVVADPEARAAIQELAESYTKEIAGDRESDLEADVLLVIQELLGEDERARLSVGDITTRFSEKFGQEYERPVSGKWIGSVIRRNLRIRTHRIQGVFVIPPSEEGRIRALFRRYRIGQEIEQGLDMSP